MSNEAKGPYWIEWSNGSRTGSVVGPNYEGPFMTVCEAKIHCDALNAAYLAGQQDKLPPDPDSHITDQEQYLEAKSKRFSAKTEGESTAEVERAMKGEPSPSILPVFTEEEIARISWTPHRSDPMATYHMGINGTMAAHAGACLRYANTKAVSVDRIMEVVKDQGVRDGLHLDDRLSNLFITHLRTRITSLFNGEG